MRIQIYSVRVTVSVHALTSFPLNGASPAELSWLAGTKKSISSAGANDMDLEIRITIRSSFSFTGPENYIILRLNPTQTANLIRSVSTFNRQ